MIELRRADINNAAEIATMVRWLNDPRVVKYSEQRHEHHTTETQDRYLRNGPDVFQKIYAGNEFIGTVTAYIDKNNSVADVGILIGEGSVWGQGYGFQAWKMFCDSLFEGGIRKIEAGHMSGNASMRAICKKYDMLCEGSRRDHFILDGITQDLVMWSAFA